MKKQFLIWLAIVFVEFIIAGTVGENKGTIYSFMYYPILTTISGGLFYFVYLIIKK